jgi:shikimate dehydrogenase
MTVIKLGLIGDNIATSRAPDLHRFCGQIAGLEVSYERLIPKQLGLTFDSVFDMVQSKGFDGINVTLPYKEMVLSRLKNLDGITVQIGAVNTVRFGAAGPVGYNTDYSGFIAAYRAALGKDRPGRALLIGAGGVGKAVAFGLVGLKATEVIVVDKNPATADALATALTRAGAAETTARTGSLADLSSVDGVINCTPLGMHGYPGSPVRDGAFPKCVWAFDAVYTPMATPFRAQAEAAGANFLSGFELFLYQGLHAFEIFTGKRVDDISALRKMLAAGVASSLGQ